MADLVFDHVELEQTLHLEDRPLYYLTCAMEENCLSEQAYEIKKENSEWHQESRRLLKFTAKITNIGTADFRSHIPKHLWEWHLCHMYGRAFCNILLVSLFYLSFSNIQALSFHGSICYFRCR